MTVDRAQERLLESLAGLDPSDLNALLEQARAQARERVLALLVEAITEASLHQVCDLLSREQRGADPASDVEPPDVEPPEVKQRVEPSPGTTELGWYVYCVIGADGATPAPILAGIDPEHTTSLLERGQLAAVVSRVALADFGEQPLREHLSDMDWLERTARAHEAVLEQFGVERTLIPMRMCAVYRSASGVLEMLERESDALLAALEQLEHKTEWGVKVFAEPDAAVGVPTAGLQLPTGGQGAAYLHKRRQERDERGELDARLETACQEIHARLSAIADDALVSAPQRPEVSGHAGDMIHNGVYLVEDGQRDRFVGELEALRAEGASLALDLVLTGPWPAYNFVPGTIGAAW